MTAPERDLARRTTAALGWNYGGAIARVLMQLLVQLTLARLLGPAAFGEATAALIVFGVGWLFAEAGFGSALIQKVSIDDDDIGYALAWVALISLAVGAAVMLTSGWLAQALGAPGIQPLVLMCGALIPLQALANLPVSLMQRRLDMKRLQLIQLGGYLVSYAGLGIGLALLGFGAWSLVAAFAGQTAITLVGSYACVRHTLRPRLHGDPALRRFGLTISATNLVNWSLDNVDRMLVGRLWGAQALGHYAVASNLSRAPMNLIVNSGQAVAFSSASRLQDDRERLARGYLAALALVFLLVAPLFAWLGQHAVPIVDLLYGRAWHQAAPLFAAFCAAVPFLAIMAITGPMLRAVGEAGAELRLQLWVLFAMVIGLALLRDQPIGWVAWLIPALALGRSLLACRSLSRYVTLSAAQFRHALAGGAAYAVVTLVCGMAMQRLIQGDGAAAVAAALLTPPVCLLLTRLLGGRLLAPELRAVLLSRAAGSPALAACCSLLGLARAPGR